MSLRIVTVGELTLDDVIYEGDGCSWKQLGGGALYSAIGALTWGASVGISSVVGADYPVELLDRLAASGIDVTGIRRIAGNSLGLWVLYERGGRRHQVEKESGSTFAELDASRPPLTESLDRVDGVHVAPQTPEGQRAALRDAATLQATVTQDLLIEPFIDLAQYRDGRAIAGSTAFLPSAQEVRQIWGDREPRDLLRHLHASAGIEVLVIKRGPAGVEIVREDGSRHVPAVSRTPVDPTGAGDAFCGGFLVGLLETGDPREAAIRGSVSASFVVETRNAPEALEVIEPGEAHRRADRVRADLKDPA